MIKFDRVLCDHLFDVEDGGDVAGHHCIFPDFSEKVNFHFGFGVFFIAKNYGIFR